MHSQKRGKPRAGFTIIEMLVVILIIMMLAGLVIAFMPGVSMRQQSERGGLLLRTALNQTKQNARRDGKAAGLRILLTPNSGGFCMGPQFIQKPDDFGGGTVNGQGNQVTLVGADLYGNPIAAGDSIEIAGSGLPHMITPGYAGGATLPLASPLPNPIAAPGTSQYRVMRAPRLMVGEAPVSLPQDVGIDLTGAVNLTSVVFFNGAATPLTSPADILFAPSGQVTGAFTGCDMICLWVRDTISAPTQAFPVLVVIYGKTGFITQHPVDPTGDPYSFAKAALSSGM